MLHVSLIGPPRMRTGSGDPIDVRGQKPWALLARLLLAERPLTRREVAVELFPDTVDPLGSVRWCLASLRKALGSSVLFTGDPIDPTLPDDVVVDVQELRRGVLDAQAVGELLEGVDPPCGPEFSIWLLVARQQVAARISALLHDETITAISRGDAQRAIELSEIGARRSPYDESAHVLLVKSLTLAGHGEAALRHVVEVEARFQAELGCAPTPALRSAARASVGEPPPGVSASTIAATLLESGRAALAAGAVDAGLDCLRRAGAQAEAAGDDALFGRCLYELGSALVHTVRGFDDEGSILLEQAALMARSAGDLSTAVSALRERGYADALAGRRPESQRNLERAGGLAAGDARLLAGVHAVAGLNLADWGHHDDALTSYRTAIELARSAGDRRWEAWSLGVGGWAALMAGRRGEALAWSAQSLAVVRDMRWAAFEPWPMAVLAEARWNRDADGDADGDADSDDSDGVSAASIAELERGFAMSCQLEDPCWEGGSGRVLALHHGRLGDHDAALRWIVEARVRCLRRTDIWSGLLGSILLTEAELRLAAGDHGGADAAGRDLVSLAARTHLDNLLPSGIAVLARTREAGGPVSRR